MYEGFQYLIRQFVEIIPRAKKIMIIFLEDPAHGHGHRKLAAITDAKAVVGTTVKVADVEAEVLNAIMIEDIAKFACTIALHNFQSKLQSILNIMRSPLEERRTS